MSKGTKTFIWVLVIAVVILIIYILISANKKTNKPAPAPTTDPITGQTVYHTDASNAGIDITTTPIKVETGQFNPGDQIYAGEDILNAYKTCSPSVNNILFTFNKGDLIGTYNRREGNCIIVTVQKNPYIFFGPKTTIEYYIPFNSNVYKK